MPPPQLGLVCITESQRCRFRTITRTHFLKQSRRERIATLEKLYWDNLHRLHGVLSFCARHDIRLYRVTSSLFPMSDERLGEQALRSFASLLAGVGRRVERLGIRVVMHPDPFVVLSSESPAVVRTSIRISIYGTSWYAGGTCSIRQVEAMGKESAIFALRAAGRAGGRFDG